MLVDDVSQLFLPITPYLILLLLAITIWAFRHRTTRLGRWRYGVLAVLLWSAFMSTPGIANALIGSMESAHRGPVSAPPASTKPLIVVLSTGYIYTDKNGTGTRVQFDTAAWERVHAGFELARQTGGRLLFVGEPSPDGKTSVAAHMATVVRSWGAPSDSIQVEEKSENTYQNLLFSREVIAAYGENAWLVTSALHMRRAMAVARKVGLRIQPYPCDYKWRPTRHWYVWLPDARGPDMFTPLLHEFVGLLMYRMRGYAD